MKRQRKCIVVQTALPIINGDRRYTIGGDMS